MWCRLIWGVVLDKIKIYGKDIEDIELIILCILSSFFLLIYDGKNYSPFACKSQVLYLVAIISIFLLFLKFFVEKSNRLKNTAHIPLFIYAALIIISALFSEYPQVVYKGLPGRLEGVYALLSYITVYFAAYYLIKKEKIYVLIYVLLTFTSIVALIGVLEFYGLNPLDQTYKELRVEHEYKIVIYSTIGNQNFIGSLMCLTLMIGIILFVSSQNKYQKIFFFITSVFLYSGLIVSRTRSAWTGTVLSLVIFLFFLIKKKYIKEVWKKLIFLFMVFFIITFLIAISSEGRIAGKFLAVVRDIKMIEADSKQMDSLGSGRFYIWKNSIPLLTEYFPFGSGPDTFPFVFPSNWEDKMRIFGDPYVIIDKAHNEFLQIGVTTGIPSLLAYLFFIAVIMLKNQIIVFKLDFFSTYDPLILASFIGCIAYLVQSFFNISVVSVAPVYWMILGINQNLVLKYVESSFKETSFS